MFFTKKIAEQISDRFTNLTHRITNDRMDATDAAVRNRVAINDVAAGLNGLIQRHMKLFDTFIGEEKAREIAQDAVAELEDTVETNHNVLVDGLNELLGVLAHSGVIKFTGTDPETGRATFTSVKAKTTRTTAKKGKKS